MTVPLGVSAANRVALKFACSDLYWGRRPTEALFLEIRRLKGRDPHGWQPIETAPKNAPERPLLLVYTPGSVCPEIAWWVDPTPLMPGHWTTGETDAYGDAQPPIEPTHWMHLPGPPSPPRPSRRA